MDLPTHSRRSSRVLLISVCKVHFLLTVEVQTVQGVAKKIFDRALRVTLIMAQYLLVAI